MAMATSIQLIHPGGLFIEGQDIDSFVQALDPTNVGLNYAVVAILGLQSSGKSTLCNHVFGTDFHTMQASSFRGQATTGVWLAKAVDLHPTTLVMDLEGTGSAERSEDNRFERQIARFAMAMSDVVIMNISSIVVGLHAPGQMPMLETIFQERLRFVTPKKITLLFVIRDKDIDHQAVHVAEEKLRNDVFEIWRTMRKPDCARLASLTEFFFVEVVSLAHYQHRPDQFHQEKAMQVRAHFINSNMAADRRCTLPLSELAESAKHIWELVRADEDLNIPSHQALVTSSKCSTIAQNTFTSLIADEEWRTVHETSKQGGFGKAATALVKKHLESYDCSTSFLQEDVARLHRDALISRVMIEAILPAQASAVEVHATEARALFTERLHTIVTDVTDVTDGLPQLRTYAQLVRDLKTTVLASFRQRCANLDLAMSLPGCEEESGVAQAQKKLFDELENASAFAVERECEEQVRKPLQGDMMSLLDKARSDTWSAVDAIVRKHCSRGVEELRSAIDSYQLDGDTKNALVSTLLAFIRQLVTKTVKDEALPRSVLAKMISRFQEVFDSTPLGISRTWERHDDLVDITTTALTAAAIVLSTHAKFRMSPLEDMGTTHTHSGEGQVIDDVGNDVRGGQVIDDVETDVLLLPLHDVQRPWPPRGPDAWGPHVDHILLSPLVCQSVWWDFKRAATDSVNLAQRTHARNCTKRNLVKLAVALPLAPLVVIATMKALAYTAMRG